MININERFHLNDETRNKNCCDPQELHSHNLQTLKMLGSFFKFL